MIASSFTTAVLVWGLVFSAVRVEAADTAGDVASALARREALLSQVQGPGMPTWQRQEYIAKAGAILDELMAEHPEHKDCRLWRLERVRDLLERADPTAFEYLLRYEFEGRDRATVAQLSGEALARLEAFDVSVKAAWAAVEQVTEEQLDRLADSGYLARLEKLDYRGEVLEVWAAFYRGLSAIPKGTQEQRLREALEGVTGRLAWTQGGAGAETLTAQGLIIAAISARRLGEHARAGRFARQAAEVVGGIAPADQDEVTRELALLAILEQIRAWRDAGELGSAKAALAQARDWVRRTRPDDVGATLAMALLEARLVTAEGSPRGDRPAILASPGRAAWRHLAGGPVDHRQILYRVLAGEVAGVAAETVRDPIVLQVVAGSAILDARDRFMASEPGPTDRLLAIDDALVRILAGAKGADRSAPEPLTPVTHGELLFLQGELARLTERPMRAVEVWTALAEHWPSHDRAVAAVREATRLAGSRVDADPQRASRRDWARFVAAATCWRKLAGECPEADRLTYAVGYGLQRTGRLAEAATVFAGVASDDPQYADALFHRARCLRRLFYREQATAGVAETVLRERAEQAIAAARKAFSVGSNGPSATMSATQPSPGVCESAEALALLLGLLNHEVVGRSGEVVRLVEQHKKRYLACPGFAGRALREKVVALRHLGRLREAREAVDGFLTADPKRAGPVMARLLQAMREEAQRARESGDEVRATQLGGDAAHLAELLVQWMSDHPQVIGPRDRQTIRIWQAWSLLDAGQVKRALALFTACRGAQKTPAGPNAAAMLDAQLGTALCRLELGRADKAVEPLVTLCRQLPRGTSRWWQAYVGSLEAHTQLGHDPQAILSSIAQRRYLSPELGGPYFKGRIAALERVNRGRVEDTQPSE